MLIAVMSAASAYADPKFSNLNSRIVPSLSTKLFGVEFPVCSDKIVSPSTNSPTTLERISSLVSGRSCSTIPLAPLLCPVMNLPNVKFRGFLHLIFTKYSRPNIPYLNNASFAYSPLDDVPERNLNDFVLPIPTNGVLILSADFTVAVCDPMVI